jgi:dihydrofolate synthase/folylpolyglutamate synthase
MSRPETVEGWLALHQQVHPLAMDFTLERLRCVLQRLGMAVAPCPVFTVGGTNGKGSVTAMAEAILRAGGKRTGLFTSPHLLHYHERIRIDGVMVTDADLLASFHAVWDACEQAPAVTLTYFEHSLAAAVWLFHRAGLDAWVLEVGLGGRLDSVNLFDADAAAVVSIGLDHVAVLGNSIDGIAREKAGIFRPGRPAVCGAAVPVSLHDCARACNAGLLRAGVEYAGVVAKGGWHFRMGTTDWPDLPLPALAGPHQVGNAAVAVALLLAGPPELRPTCAAVEAGLGAARVLGRFERYWLFGREWIVDVAHNPAAAEVLSTALRGLPAAPTNFLLGVLGDKDLAGVLAGLAQAGLPLQGVALGLGGERGRTGAEFAQLATAAGYPGLRPTEDAATACADLQAIAGPGGRIVACGSFVLVTPVLEWLLAQGATREP